MFCSHSVVNIFRHDECLTTFLLRCIQPKVPRARSLTNRIMLFYTKGVPMILSTFSGVTISIQLSGRYARVLLVQTPFGVVAGDNMRRISVFLGQIMFQTDRGCCRLCLFLSTASTSLKFSPSINQYWSTVTPAAECR